MSMELRKKEASQIQAIWEQWKTSDQYELECSIKNIDLTSFQDTIARLRAVGLREVPQVPKLNIMMPGCLRFTIVGEGSVQSYCNNNDITQVPYTVVIKERCTVGTQKQNGAQRTDQVDLPEYNVRVKLRREIPLDKDDARVVEMISRWKSTPKRFRYLRRYTFLGPEGSGMRFDLTAVRESKRDTKGNYVGSESFKMADILRRPLNYEIEAEVDRDDKVLKMPTPKSFTNSIGLLLQGVQRSYVLTRKSIAASVIETLTSGLGSRPNAFPGPQPVTLERKNIAMEQEEGVNNLRFADYNVTDKADGIRCLLLVMPDGYIYLIDNILRVYSTGLRLPAPKTALYKGTILDGEWIRRDKNGMPVSEYYAFDIYVTAQGQNVTQLPFISKETDVTRLAALNDAVENLSDATQRFSMPDAHSVIINVKTFYSTGRDEIFSDASTCLENAKKAKYNTDGLIFTPNADTLPTTGTTWEKQLKWKPVDDNTIDFLVVTEKLPSGEDKLGHKYREDTKQMVRYKTLRLFVGGKMDPAFRDPRDAIVNLKPLPESNKPGDYRPVEFTPLDPADPMASVCYVSLDAGVADPAGAAAAAQDTDSKDETIYCTRSGDPILSDCIVEMAYHPEMPAGWRWEPIRVRWDKTERFQRKMPGRTMNADWVSDNIWSSIHNPVSEDMICTGNLAEESTAEKPYYVSKKKIERDNAKTGGLARFHNEHIKSEILLKKSLRRGNALLDLACGRAGDLHKWVKYGVGWVMGVDKNLDCLTQAKSGAYARYLDKIISAGDRKLPPMIFIQGSSTQNIRDMTAGATDLDKRMIRALYDFPEKAETPALVEQLRGRAAKGFDVVSCMFALHYFFQNRSTVDGFLQNVADNLKVGGLFVGCCFDGDSVFKLLKKTKENGVKTGNDGESDIWSIRRMFGPMTDDVLPPNDAGLGKAVDVFFLSIGEEHREYLVSFDYLKRRMQEIGCELLNPDELSKMELTKSTALFGETYEEDKLKYDMSEAVQKFSFLNRWFVFRRRSNGTLKAAAREEPATAETTTVEESNVESNEESVPESNEERPVFKFFHKAKPGDELKIGRKDWARYISTFQHSRIRDLKKSTVIYPSLEAAFASARYQTASANPDLGPKLFATTGDLHQKYLKKRREEAKAGAITEKREQELLEEEGGKVRDLIDPTEMERLGAKFNEAKWNASKDKIMRDYIQQRYETDTEFKRILDAVKKVNGRLVFYNGSKPTELGGVVKPDGSISGQNKLGVFYMQTVGLSA